MRGTRLVTWMTEERSLSRMRVSLGFLLRMRRSLESRLPWSRQHDSLLRTPLIILLSGSSSSSILVASSLSILVYMMISKCAAMRLRKLSA